MSVCAPGCFDDHTLCGIAYEGECIGDSQRPVVASKGSRITCEDCLRLIEFCRSFKKRNAYYILTTEAK